jgi:hypothetical protein
MKHNELMDKIYWHWRRDLRGADGLKPMLDYRSALLAAVELHKPTDSRGDSVCAHCPTHNYPCPTIQAIEEAVKL